ncbi:amidase (acetamidase) [Fusarium mundagurra]|uniref:Amidase (Acetamidase) n=1 Tax=Fusarium mundagurra TaxID=1567541 RepID=A0A8H5YUA4_9HYPO|nr:amidase (acetamidase) [Fusarium mundagurra]
MLLSLSWIERSKASDILHTYEVLLSSAEQWLTDGSLNLKGPLAGIPVSLKDTVELEGYDSTIGMSTHAGKPLAHDGNTVRILKDAGAVPYVKTNVPIALLSFESSNDIWGETSNPYNKGYTAGGSTGDIEKEFCEKRNLRVGILRTDGVVDPSPACRRALEMTESALRNAGHEIVEVDPPSPYEALCLASILLCSDGLQTVKSFFRWGEWNDRGAAQMSFYFSLPRPAGLLRNWHPQSGYEIWQLNAKRELYKRKWFEWWDNSGIDCLITPPNATPAVPHRGMHDACSSCGYTFIFNLLDYTAGVLPVTHVDKIRDQLPGDFSLKSLNGIAQGAYKLYDANAMHGLPVGVQVIGRRLEEEKVLAIMKKIEEAMGDNTFPLLDID